MTETADTIARAKSIEAEQALLGRLLTQNSCWYSLEELKAEHFAEPIHQEIYAEISRAIESGIEATPITLNHKFNTKKDGENYLMRIAASSLHVINPLDYARLIIEMHTRRVIIDKCLTAASTASDITDAKNPKEIIEGLLLDLTSIDNKANLLTEAQMWEKLLDRLKAPSVCFPTGIEKLDKAMSGGVIAGMVYGFLARKKTGKTMLAITLSDNLAECGAKHIYFALEMGSERIHMRSAARKLGINEAALMSDYGKSIDCARRVAKQASEVKNTRIWRDAPGLTLQEMKREIMRAVRVAGISGFILDCWQLVGGRKRGQSLSEHLDEVAQAIAELCAKYKIWAIVTAQENQDENTRGGEGLRLACDQMYRLVKEEETSDYAWLEMTDTRYTGWMDIGSKNSPALKLINGTHFEQVSGTSLQHEDYIRPLF